MAQHVGFIDFGFLKAGAIRPLKAKSPTDLRPRPEAVVAWLDSLGPPLPASSAFLRAYWYDGAYDGGHRRHAAQRRFFDGIANTPGIQLRLGHLQEIKAPKWQYPVKAALEMVGVDLEEFEQHFQFKPELSQKGVDTRITLDMVRLAQRHVYDTAILVAGDRDLAEPVRVAQDEGRRVIVAVPQGAGLASELRQLADDVIALDETILSEMFEIPSSE